MIKGLKIINIVMALSVVSISALLVKDYLVYRFNPQHEKGGVGTIGYRTIAKHPLMYYRGIVETPAFSTAINKLIPITPPGAGEAAGGDAVSLPKDLLLMGTVVGLGGYAVFEKKGNGKEEIFKVGDDVFGSGILKAVRREEVVLLMDGREMVFEIPTERLQLLRARNRFANGMRDDNRGAVNPFPLSAQTQRLSKKVGKDEWLIDRKAVLKAVEDMGQILSDARLTPNLVEGKVNGFRITEIRRRGVFDAIGLKNGDILVSVNGYAIDGPEKAVQVLSGLKGETNIDLDVIRRGRKMSFHYQMK